MTAPEPAPMFLDGRGDLWEIALDGDKLAALKESTKLDLAAALATDHRALFDRVFCHEPPLLAALLYLAAAPGPADAGLSYMDFFSRMMATSETKTDAIRCGVVAVARMFPDSPFARMAAGVDAVTRYVRGY